jgi:hypothetical protein
VALEVTGDLQYREPSKGFDEKETEAKTHSPAERLKCRSAEVRFDEASWTSEST